jgi:hypothetical protein
MAVAGIAISNSNSIASAPHKPFDLRVSLPNTTQLLW